MGGLAGRTPVYAATFGFFVFAGVGLPGLSGFVGEFLVLLGSFAYNPAVAAIATFVHDLRRRLPAVDVPADVLRRPVGILPRAWAHLTDISPVEMLTLVPLATLVVVFGLFPGLLLRPRPGHRRRTVLASSPPLARSTSSSGSSGARPIR